MKIAVVHSFYSEKTPSGENDFVSAQVEALQKGGFDVKLFSVKTDVLSKRSLYKLRSAFKVATGIGLNPLRDIKKFSPQVVIVHNLFPNYGSSWLTKVNVPVLFILHNFRSFCAAGTFYRNEKICFDCISESPFRSVVNRCYRKSRLATFPLFLAQKRRMVQHSSPGTQVFVALSPLAKAVSVKCGIPEKDLQVIPNYVEDFTVRTVRFAEERSDRWVAVGRITKEKGFVELVKNWPTEFHLDIIGDGPAREHLHRLVSDRTNIRILGRYEKQKLHDELPSYAGAIFSSLVMENSPLSFIEYICAGLPVISLKGNAISEYILNGKAGQLVDSWTEASLREAISEILRNESFYRINSRALYEHTFSQEKWLEAMTESLNSLV